MAANPLPQNPDGMLQAGTIDLNNRPVVHNADGSISTEFSFSRGTNKGETLVPRVVGGNLLSEDAWKHHQQTGEHLGIFDTPDHGFYSLTSRL